MSNLRDSCWINKTAGLSVWPKSMSATQGGRVEPFYFMSYGTVIGVARSVADLQKEMGRLAGENPGALEYHLREGHIVKWLESMNEREAAEQLRRIQTAEGAKVWTGKQRGGEEPRKASGTPSGTSRKKRSRRAR